MVELTGTLDVDGILGRWDTTNEKLAFIGARLEEISGATIGGAIAAAATAAAGNLGQFAGSIVGGLLQMAMPSGMAGLELKLASIDSSIQSNLAHLTTIQGLMSAANDTRTIIGDRIAGADTSVAAGIVTAGDQAAEKLGIIAGRVAVDGSTLAGAVGTAGTAITGEVTVLAGRVAAPGSTAAAAVAAGATAIEGKLVTLADRVAPAGSAVTGHITAAATGLGADLVTIAGRLAPSGNSIYETVDDLGETVGDSAHGIVDEIHKFFADGTRLDVAGIITAIGTAGTNVTTAGSTVGAAVAGVSTAMTTQGAALVSGMTGISTQTGTAAGAMTTAATNLTNIKQEQTDLRVMLQNQLIDIRKILILIGLYETDPATLGDAIISGKSRLLQMSEQINRIILAGSSDEAYWRAQSQYDPDPPD